MPGMPVPGAEWAGFRIEEQIGSGGFAQVFSAWEVGVDRRVALKVVPAGTDPAATARFVRESRLAADLAHPGIVPIHRVAELDGMAYLVMGHIGGGDLAQEIHTSPLTLDRVRSVMGQLGGALDRAHRAGVVHRGVEPANVLCGDGDEVYLTGFGAPEASVHDASPELVRGEVLTPASDVYALGCTLFECLTGRVPFPAETPEQVASHHLGSPPPRVTALRPDLSSELDEIVARAMAKDPAERHPSTRHLAEAVALVRTDTAGSHEPTAAILAVEPEAAEPDVVGGRSVFDEPTAVSAPLTAPVAVTAPPIRRGDAPLDGAAFGIYEEERRRSRLPVVIGALLVVATLVVGALVLRAINTDAELSSDTAPSTSSTTPDEDAFEVTVDSLRALVPSAVDTCVEPQSDAVDVPIVFLCPLDGVPESLALELHASTADRDARFAQFVDDLGVSDRDDAECALGRMGRHDYAADGHGGEVACIETGGLVEFVWTRDDAPVVLVASGGGRFAEYEDAWEELAERTDGTFPLPEEQMLLDALPQEFLVDCARDLTLAIDAGGEVAAACKPPDASPTVISWVLFADDDPMDDWIDSQRASLDSNNFDTTDDGCSPQGFGQVDSLEETTEVPDEDEPADSGEAAPIAGPPPDAAYLDYDIDGSNGTVLCFVNTNGLNAVFWTRDGSRIGSIAVSDRGAGDSMIDLLRWWRDGGHRP
ncbi:serine/threonine protein kinase [Actinospongicola halichondriae]|uniref:serine/threonine protein kinase n=1 Tax=Actinospongicola halichondriae TaxID=3236844 RepID=UPI003D54FFC1